MIQGSLPHDRNDLSLRVAQTLLYLDDVIKGFAGAEHVDELFVAHRGVVGHDSSFLSTTVYIL